MTNIQTAIQSANQWTAHARPIIKAYLAMEEVCLAAAICEVHYGRTDADKQRTRDYREADGYRKEAQQKMLDLVEGIRDNYRCDYLMDASRDATDAEWDEVEAFNDELERSLITVEAAVRMVEDER